jgi:DME family drug/metabolite transporter
VTAARARLAVVGAAICWSTAGAAIKLAGGLGLTGWQTGGGRAIVAAAVMALLMPGARRGWNGRTAAVAVAYALTTTLFVIANTLTTSANAIFLQDVAPLWVILLSPWLLGERPTRQDLLSAPIYIGGTALFFIDELAPGAGLGNLMAILSGVAFAFLILGLRWLRDGGADAAVLQGNLLAFLICLPGAVRGGPITEKALAVVTFLGVFQLGLAYVLFNRGVRVVSAVEASLLALVEPVLNPIWAFLLAGERPGKWAIAGGTMILAATVWKVVAPARGTPSG